MLCKQYVQYPGGNGCQVIHGDNGYTIHGKISMKQNSEIKKCDVFFIINI